MFLLALLLWIVPPARGVTADSVEWGASTLVSAGSGRFVPSYIAANRYGTLTQAGSAYESAWLRWGAAPSSRLSFEVGIKGWAGTGSSVDYDRYDPSQLVWYANGQRPAYVWLQELYGKMRFRSIFVELGMRDYDRSIFDDATGSGDIVLGRNARGIPQLRVGFDNFVNVPLTKGWLKIQGEIAYGKFVDNNWLENHFNRYNSFLTTGVWFHYKRLYLRSDDSRPFSVTVGMQHAAQFGGVQKVYHKGVQTAENKSAVRAKDFFDVFVPRRDGSGSQSGDKAYYNGNHLGSWDLRLRYRFPQGSELTFYMQSPWEDGSGIGKLNGWDGVWGLRYRNASGHGWLTGASVEYIDFSNQSGPMHWAPGDFPGTGVGNEATGADDYYNNYFYDGWANNGMGLGSPLVKSPVYNTDGYLRFTDNRIRGFHLGLEGAPAAAWRWRLLTGYTRSLGTPFLPRVRKAHNYSLMLEATHDFVRVEGLRATAQAGLDAGDIFGHRYGISLALSYSGAFSVKKRSRR